MCVIASLPNGCAACAISGQLFVFGGGFPSTILVLGWIAATLAVGSGGVLAFKGASAPDGRVRTGACLAVAGAGLGLLPIGYGFRLDMKHVGTGGAMPAMVFQYLAVAALLGAVFLWGSVILAKEGERRERAAGA